MARTESVRRAQIGVFFMAVDVAVMKTLNMLCMIKEWAVEMSSGQLSLLKLHVEPK